MNLIHRHETHNMDTDSILNPKHPYKFLNRNYCIRKLTKQLSMLSTFDVLYWVYGYRYIYLFQAFKWSWIYGLAQLFRLTSQ